MKAVRNIAAIVIFAAGVTGCSHHWERSASEVCAINLRTLDMAKQQWFAQEHKTTNAVPTMEDLRGYLKVLPACPTGGTYTLGPVGKYPTCSIKGHVLPIAEAH